MKSRKEKQGAQNLYARNIQCFINDYEMTNNSPHKKRQGALGKASGRKVSHCLLQILKQMSQLLRNKRNWYKIPSRLVTRSTVGSRVYLVVNVRIFLTVFNGINSPITDA